MYIYQIEMINWLENSNKNFEERIQKLCQNNNRSIELSIVTR